MNRWTDRREGGNSGLDFIHIYCVICRRTIFHRKYVFMYVAVPMFSVRFEPHQKPQKNYIKLKLRTPLLTYLVHVLQKQANYNINYLIVSGYI